MFERTNHRWESKLEPRQVNPIRSFPCWWFAVDIRAANLNMCLPTLIWQSMEIEFKAARFDGKTKISPAVVSVVLDGMKVHDNVSLPEGTGGGPSGPRAEVSKGPIVLQNHGNPNLFRNIWIVPQEQSGN